MRAQGLRPVQIWVPDTRAAGFAEEYRRQCEVVNQASAADPEMALWDAWIDEGNVELHDELVRLERRE